MKTILCYGNSYVWGCVPGSLNPQTGLWQRHTKDKRWTGILQNELGDEFEIVTEGMNGRTTNIEEIIPGNPYKNGLAYLPFCLEAHYPIDLVIFMLGTNDTKIQFNRTAEAIAEAMLELIQVVKASNKGPDAKSPKILLIAAPSTIKAPNLSSQRDDASIEKTHRIPKLYQQLAQEEECDFLDASLVVSSSLLDGVHLDKAGNKLLGHAVAKKVKQIFSRAESLAS